MIQWKGKMLCENCLLECETELCTHCGVESAAINTPVGCLPTKTILQERYIIGKVLGRGGFGITYLAFDMAEECRVAIKEYFPDTLVFRQPGEMKVTTYTNNDQAESFRTGAEKFYAEAQTMARFNGHPNVVSVKRFFYENQTAYYVMEYLDGIDLKKYIDQNGKKLSWESTLKLLLPVMDALMLVHSTNILHRDISPDNIFVLKDGTVKLLDFGSARQVLSEQSKSLSVVLKVGFAPIEQYQSHGKQGPWTDVYALAATVYYCLTGVVPVAAMDRVEEDSLKKISELCPEIGTKADEVFEKALAVRSVNRYQSVNQFRDALLALNSSKSVFPALQERSVEKKPEKASFWKNIVVALVAAVIVLLGVVGLMAGLANSGASKQTGGENSSYGGGGGQQSVEWISETPEPTVTNTPTPEPTATNTPMPEPTATNTPTPKPTPTINNIELVISSDYVVVGENSKNIEKIQIEVIRNGYDGEYTLYYETENSSIVQCQWGEWVEEDVTELFISAVSGGETIIRITVEDTNICKEIKVVSVLPTPTPEPTIPIEKMEIDISQNYVEVDKNLKELLISVRKNGYKGDFTLTYEIENDGIIQCQWGEWVEKDVTELFISAIGSGETTVKISVKGTSISEEIKVVSLLPSPTPKPTNTPIPTISIEAVELELSKSYLEVGKDAQKIEAKIIRNGYNGGCSLVCEIKKEGIIQCEWGEWIEQDVAELFINAVGSGETVVKVSIKDTNISKEIRVISSLPSPTPKPTNTPTPTPIPGLSPIPTEIDIYYNKDRSAEMDVIIYNSYTDMATVTKWGGELYDYRTGQVYIIPQEYIDIGERYIRIHDEYLLEKVSSIYEVKVYIYSNNKKRGRSKVLEIYQGIGDEKDKAFNFSFDATAFSLNDSRDYIGTVLYGIGRITSVEATMLGGKTQIVPATYYDLLHDAKVIVLKKEFFVDYFKSGSKVTLTFVFDNGLRRSREVEFVGTAPTPTSTPTPTPKLTGNTIPKENWPKPTLHFYSGYMEETEVIWEGKGWGPTPTNCTGVCYSFADGSYVNIPDGMVTLGDGYVWFKDEFLKTLSPSIYEMQLTVSGFQNNPGLTDTTSVVLEVHDTDEKPISTDPPILRARYTPASTKHYGVTMHVNNQAMVRFTGAWVSCDGGANYDKLDETKYKIEADGRVMIIDKRYFGQFEGVEDFTIIYFFDDGNSYNTELYFYY